MAITQTAVDLSNNLVIVGFALTTDFVVIRVV